MKSEYKEIEGQGMRRFITEMALIEASIVSLAGNDNARVTEAYISKSIVDSIFSACDNSAESTNQNITLDFPNFEVENSFYNYLFADYIEKNYTENFSIISLLQNSLENNNLNDFIASLTSIFSNITYHQVRADEAYFHTVFFLIIKMLGFNIECEVLTNIGRIDAVIKTKTTIYIIEFKLSDAETALQQIKDKKYHEKYLENKKQIILLGIGFNKNKRNIEDWKVEILNS